MKNFNHFLLGFGCAALILVGACRTSHKPVVPAKAPPVPAQMDFKPLTSSLTGVVGDVTSAQGNLHTGLEFARKGDAVDAVPPLEAADTDLGSALLKLSTAQTQVSALEAENTTLFSTFKQREAVNSKNLADTNKSLVAANKQIVQLQNEYTRKIRDILATVAAILFVAGALSVASQFIPALSFLPGLKVGLVLIGAASIMGVFALYLNQILFWTGISILAGTLGAVGYAVWHLYHHVSPAVVTALKAAAPTVPEAAALVTKT